MCGVELTEHLDFLDRQADFFRRLVEDRELLVAVPGLLSQLDGDPVIRDVLHHLNDDAATVLADYKRAADDVRSKLRRLAEDFAARSQTHQHEIDDVRVMIDRVTDLNDESLPFNPTTAFDLPLDAPLAALEAIRLELANAHGQWERDFQSTAQQLPPLYETHNYEKRRLTIRIWTDASFSLLRLRGLADLMNPKPQRRVRPSGYPRTLTLGGVIDRFVFGPQAQNTLKADTSLISEVASRVRDDAERLLLELRRQLNVRRSRHAVLRRFQTWAQWYARDYLRHIVGVSGEGKKSRQIEVDLTEQLARFLFREGLDPLWQPLLGRVKPDLLDPGERGRLYVEAKWAAASADVLPAVAQGVRQALDSAILLVGTSHRVDEAFVVVFQGEGARVDVPAVISLAELSTRLVVIDLSPWEQIGSRRREKPVVIAEAELVNRVEQIPAAAQPSEAEEGRE